MQKVISIALDTRVPSNKPRFATAHDGLPMTLLLGLMFLTFFAMSSPVFAGEPAAKKEVDRKPAREPIVIPVPIGQGVKGIRFPDFDTSGRILSQFIAGEALHMEDNRVRIDSLTVELYNEDAKKEFRIDLPKSLLDLQNRRLLSEDPVRLVHSRFELRGETLDFDGENRTGEIKGRVHMVIYNAGELMEEKREDK